MCVWCSESDNEQDQSVSNVSNVDFELQSVLSEADKGSLDAAMKMMGHSDLQQVEDEVRTFISIIQVVSVCYVPSRI